VRLFSQRDMKDKVNIHLYSSCFKIHEAEQPLHVVALACSASGILK
jgi:hypothetical protein